MTDDRDRWNDRYREDAPPEEPAAIVREHAADLPRGTALDLACGGGRNAIFLAERDFDVTGIDVSDEALAHARRRADDAGVDVDFVRADANDVDLEEGAYDVIVVTYFRTRERLPDLVDALAPGGVLCYEHRLETGEDRRFRVRSNELLRACLGLRIVRYEEPIDVTPDDCTVRLMARRPR
ncbi:class I SAM-dependent methyltransferase [Natronococcus wangiae]|uniref:class I SAM-dependent methyltransferase n=1 Tax=Natronococcus wangiae TaxID=3068275 RepID=UPI00273DC48A|nr:class I SAM-dependent methyltransferase [Natronococcus sp. AD5]